MRWLRPRTVHLILWLIDTHPQLTILAISMHCQRTLIRAVMDEGAGGYILKDDRASIQQIATILHCVADGGSYLSPRTLGLAGIYERVALIGAQL